MAYGNGLMGEVYGRFDTRVLGRQLEYISSWDPLVEIILSFFAAS